MKKVLLFAVSIILCSVTNAEFNVLTSPNVITEGRCNMGYCSWSKSINTRILSKTNKSVLLEATMLGGSSDFDPEENNSGDQKIEWNKKPHKLIINCSHSNPFISINSQITKFDFSSEDATPAVLEGDANVYFKYCHSFTNYYADGLKEFGYLKN